MNGQINTKDEWVSQLVRQALPFEIQRKIVQCETLTKKELNQVATLLTLAARAEPPPRTVAAADRRERADVLDKLDTIIRKLRCNGALLRETLWHASGKLPQYKPTDKRSVGVIKEGMVQTAIDRILGGESISPRAIAYSVLKQYQGTPGAYTNLDTFTRQVTRVLAKSGHD